jgi:hypothetical protein
MERRNACQTGQRPVWHAFRLSILKTELAFAFGFLLRRLLYVG